MPSEETARSEAADREALRLRRCSPGPRRSAGGGSPSTQAAFERRQGSLGSGAAIEDRAGN